jgi:Lon protease-like protein
MRMTDVPLFPLELVLFPQMVLPLHIFEQRYRQMISDCLKNNMPFGVVMLASGDSVQEGRDISEPARPAAVGTLARITEVTRIPDGRMIIETIGTERFRLIEFHNDKAYMTGDIEIWEDGISLDPRLDDEMIEVRQTFESYLEILMELAGRRIEGLEIPQAPDLLSYFIPNWLQINMDDKQRLLEAPDPFERLRAERLILHSELQLLQKVKEEASRQLSSLTDEPPTNPPMGYDVTSRFSKN